MEENRSSMLQSMGQEALLSALESILFAAGNPVKKTELENILGISPAVLEDLLDAYDRLLRQPERGIKLLRLEKRVQLGTKEDNADFLKALLGLHERQGLSKGALECLAIVAFKQPVTRVEIDEIRGVSSDYVVQKLLEKGLMKMVGRKDAPGRPKLYGTTDEFLIEFGFTSLQEMMLQNPLPKKFEAQAMEHRKAVQESMEFTEDDA